MFLPKLYWNVISLGKKEEKYRIQRADTVPGVYRWESLAQYLARPPISLKKVSFESLHGGV